MLAKNINQRKMESEEKANTLVIEAEKKLKSWFNFFGEKNEEACELYEKAANLYKVAKKYEAAGNIYLKVAECYKKCDSKNNRASAYHEAAKCFSKVESMSPRIAISAIEQSIEIHSINGKLVKAAGMEKELAELYEKNNENETACKHYRIAAEYYENENQQAHANSCLDKVGDLEALLGNYSEAIKAFEKVAYNKLDSQLVRSGAKEYLFKAIICNLADHSIVDSLYEVKDKLEEYIEKDVNFDGSKESELMSKLLQASENRDIIGFVAALRVFDSIKRLDPWKITLFKKIKDDIMETDLR